MNEMKASVNDDRHLPPSGQEPEWQACTGTAQAETAISSIEHSIHFACPKCRRDVVRDENTWSCGGCGIVGCRLDGIPCFTDPEYYWGEISREEMRRANLVADIKGWRAAVEEVVPSPDLREYVSGPGRADFQYIWDLPSSATILDVAAGWGAIASELGRNFDFVVAAEGAFERTRFIARRAGQERLRSVHAICADFLNLPFAPGQFDAIVLNGVLEWVGMASLKGDPRRLQLQFLKRIKELLKPKGLVCVGIENRIGYAMFRGGIDHSGLPYTSLMPRSLARTWCRFRQGQYRSNVNTGYRTYTYSLGGYRKLFQEAGFGRINAFHAYDGYNRPSTLLPLSNENALAHFVKRLELASQGWSGWVREQLLIAAARTGLWANTASEYVFLLTRA